MTTTSEFPHRRVLVVAYYFPPMGLSGVQRTLKFVKYFPSYGWDPTVLTVEPNGYIAKDESLLNDISGLPVSIVRTPTAGPARLLRRKEVIALPPEWVRKSLSMVSDTLFIPDNKIGWRKKAVARAVALHKENPFDMIFVTAPPFTDFLIGMDIKAAINRPLVFDYRDPWADYPFRFNLTPFHKLRHIALERRALRASSHVVTTNRRVKELILNRYKFLTYHDIDIIPQGYDPEDLAAAKAMLDAGPHSQRTQMRFIYAGVFWEDRVPDHFLTALHLLFKEQPRLRGRIEAAFVGNFREENKKLVTKLGLEDSVKVLGYLPHRECLREVLASDVAWVVVGDDKGSPGKVYEYIGARKTILGLAPEGFIRQAIEEAHGVVVPPKDVEAIKQAILSLFERFLQKQLPVPSEEVVAKYNRSNLSCSVVRIFESLLAP